MKSRAIELSRAFGMLFEDEVVFLMEVASKLPKDATIINFGAGFGTSGLAFREACPDAYIATLDITKEGNPLGGLGNEQNAFRNAGMLDKLPEQFHTDSSTFGFNVQKTFAEGEDMGIYDFVFVDGDHSREGLTKDILAFKPLVKKGGMMAFHDYERDVWPDVQQTVDKMMSDWKEVGHVHTLKILANE